MHVMQSALTWACNRYPLVEFIVVRHSVKFTALHLSEGGMFSGTRFCVANSVALPLACTIFASKLRSVHRNTNHDTDHVQKNVQEKTDGGGIEMGKKRQLKSGYLKTQNDVFLRCYSIYDRAQTTHQKATVCKIDAGVSSSVFCW